MSKEVDKVYEISRLDPATVGNNCTWLLIGKRRSGKSRLLFDLLYHTRANYDIAFAMAETNESFQKLKKMVPCDRCKPKYAESFVIKIVEGMKKWHMNTGRGRRNAVLIQDDCMFNKGILKSECQRDLHMNGRNYGMTTFNTTQYLVDTPPAIRTNIDFVVALKEPSKDNRKKLYKYFFGVFPTFKSFESTFMAITEDFGAMVVDNSGSKCGVEDTIKWYRADPNIPIVKLGKKVFFKIADKKRKQRREAALVRKKEGKVRSVVVKLRE